MVIYIDLLIILNFVYDLLLLTTVSVVLKRHVKYYKLLLGAFLGSISTIIILIDINKYILLFLKIFNSFIITIVTFNYKNIKYFCDNILYLYMCSVILAGFLYFLKIEFNNLSYFIILLIAPFILYLYIHEQRKLKQIMNYYENVIITFKNNKSIELLGYIDSGNHLKDPITHKYIILINKSKLNGIYNIRNPIYVAINTVNKHSLIPCIAIKNIKVKDKTYSNYLLGIVDNLIINSDYDCLLNSILTEEKNV